MSKNFFEQFIASDLELCRPVQVPGSLAAISDIAKQLGFTPEQTKIVIDLEQMQVVDYSAFPELSDTQKQSIRLLQSREPVRSDEMAFLSLRSLLAVVLPEPTSEADTIKIINFEEALNDVLTAGASQVASLLHDAEAMLPYWGRLSFLRVMSALPQAQIAAHGLDKVCCAMIKSPSFNASTFAFTDGQRLIGINFALEPILKNINRRLLHFYHTQHLAGPSRMDRAWSELLPTVHYFWSGGSANKLYKNCLIFNEEEARTAQWLTVAQTDFIVRHELAHVVFDHPTQLKNLLEPGESGSFIQHEFEFAADLFAFDLLRSQMFNAFARTRFGDAFPTETDKIAATNNAIVDYMQEYQAVALLFAYMTFIDDAGQLIRRRIGDSFTNRKTLDSHPSGRSRYARLKASLLGDVPHSTDLVQYALRFFGQVLDHAETLSTERLIDNK